MEGGALGVPEVVGYCSRYRGGDSSEISGYHYQKLYKYDHMGVYYNNSPFVKIILAYVLGHCQLKLG